MLRKGIVDFGVSWYWLFTAGSWIEIDVVPGTVTVENTAGLGQLPNQLTPLHRTISLIS